MTIREFIKQEVAFRHKLPPYYLEKGGHPYDILPRIKSMYRDLKVELFDHGEKWLLKIDEVEIWFDVWFLETEGNIDWCFDLT